MLFALFFFDATMNFAQTPAQHTNGKIAFTSGRDGNLEIYVMNPDGTNQVRITSNDVVDASPTWSPDGRKIAFVGQKQNGSFAIFTMNADGNDRAEITPLSDSYWATWRPLSWSLNGRRIAFQDYSTASTSMDIFVVNLDGSGRQNLTADHAHLDLTPTWSPDGSKIIFSRYDLYDPPGWGGTMLHSINADGTNLTRLANGFADGWNEDTPDWSPVVNKIVYSVNRWDFVNDLYIANPDGTGRQFFHGCDWTDNSCKLDAFSPTFSPDGTKIAFAVFDFIHNTPQQLYVKNLDGTGLTLLTNNGASPSWQPLAPAAACPNPIDCPEFLVRQHYLDFLNRQPDAPGLEYWSNKIIACSGDQVCIDNERVNVSAAFFLSIEFQETGYLVYRTYKSAYGNLSGAPVPIKLNEFLPDTQQIGQGVIVGQSGWEQLLRNNQQNFFAGFVQRTRFSTAFPTSLTPDQFVDQLFLNAGVTPAVSDRAAAVNEFGGSANTTDIAARARSLRRIAENSTLAQQEFNRAFVLMQYFGYLGRNPNDLPDSTFDGYYFWLDKLEQFNGNYINAQMVKAFIDSIEYRQRFAP